MAFVTPASLPRTGLAHSSAAVSARPAPASTVVYAPLDVRAAKHVQFKAAKKAERMRPRKHRPSDIHRAPPSFDPNPLGAEGLPAVLEVFSEEEGEKAFAGRNVIADAAMVEAAEQAAQAALADVAEPVEEAAVPEPVAEVPAALADVTEPVEEAAVPEPVAEVQAAEVPAAEEEPVAEASEGEAATAESTE